MFLELWVMPRGEGHQVHYLRAHRKAVVAESNSSGCEVCPCSCELVLCRCATKSLLVQCHHLLRQLRVLDARSLQTPSPLPLVQVLQVFAFVAS